MSEKENGGPAFPVGSGDMRDPTGMTLRDYFAAAALKGIIEGAGKTHRVYKSGSTPDCEPEAAARYSYTYADAMIAARQR